MGTYRTKHGVVVPEHAIRAAFSRASGPGGQHVNTSSTKVQVSIDIDACGFDEATAATLHKVFGTLVITSSSESRSQWRNRSDALRRALIAMDEALVRVRPRVATKATRRARERRLTNKAHQSQRKAERRYRDED